MFRFIRRIKRKLISEGNLNRYLIYAIGEVLLLVIGILIALQVSNWNTQKKNSLQAQKVLSALHNEFAVNKTKLTQVKSFHDRVIKASDGLLNLISSYPEGYSEKTMDRLLREHGYYMTFDPHNSVLETAISSGDIHLIENDSLINLLFSWPSMVSDSNEEEIQSKQLLFQHKDFLFKYIREIDIWREIDTLNKQRESRFTHNYRESRFPHNYIGLLKNPEFENIVIFRQGIVIELVREQNAILEINNSILTLIEAEMK